MNWRNPCEMEALVCNRQAIRRGALSGGLLKEKFNAHTSVNTNIEEISCLPLFPIRFH